MDFQIFPVSVGIIVSIVWGIILYEIGKSKRDYDLVFYFLLYSPVCLDLFISILANLQFLLQLSIVINLAIILCVLIERIIWGITLRKVSGESKLSWFFIILLAPLVGWMFYWVTETW